MSIPPTIAALTHAQIREMDMEHREGVRSLCQAEIARAERIRIVCEWITGPCALVAAFGGSLSIVHVVQRKPWEPYWFALYCVSAASALLWLATHRALSDARDLAQREAAPYREVLHRIHESEIARKQAAERRNAEVPK